MALCSFTAKDFLGMTTPQATRQGTRNARASWSKSLGRVGATNTLLPVMQPTTPFVIHALASACQRSFDFRFSSLAYEVCSVNCPLRYLDFVSDFSGFVNFRMRQVYYAGKVGSVFNHSNWLSQFHLGLCDC